MDTQHILIRQQWLQQAERDIRALRQEGSTESLQAAQLLQEALDECALLAFNPQMYLQGSSCAQSDDLVLEGALDFMRSRRGG